MLRPVEKAEKIKKDAKNLYNTVAKAYKLVETFEPNNQNSVTQLESFIRMQPIRQYSGALATGANNLQKVLQNTCNGKMQPEEALRNLQTINISVMTAEMVAAEILQDGKQTSIDEERF